MSLKLSQNNVIPYQYYSENTGLTPITTQVILDNTGGIKGSDVVSAFLIATEFNYTTINVSPVSEQVGINWRVSLDNIVWAGSAQLEIIVDGNVFTPWIDQVEFKETLKVVAEVVSEKDVVSTNKKVQVGASLINETVVNKEISPIKIKKGFYKPQNISDDYI